MKKVFSGILVLLCFSLCTGFSIRGKEVKIKKEKPVIILSSAPVIKEDAMTRTENVFLAGQRTSLLFYYPEGFGDSVLKMTIYKLSDKTNTLGHEIVRSRDIRVDIGDKQYSDYFVIYKSGIYQIQFIEIRKPRRILAYARFKVQ